MKGKEVSFSSKSQGLYAFLLRFFHNYKKKLDANLNVKKGCNLNLVSFA
jgi:hypothetical protein